jgi:hypothetical protein
MTEKRLWMHAWLARTELDRRLAEGTNPTTDPLRAMRARQLGSRRYRRALSAGLRRLAAEGCATGPGRRIAVPPVNRDAVREAREPLLSLARKLLESEHPCPRAVAPASYLVCDPQSPAYWEPTGVTVADLAAAALGTIDDQPLR